MIKLKKLIEDIQNVNEGLISTYPINDAISILKTWCSYGNKIKYSKSEKVKILANITSISEHELDVLLKYANNLGYYPSFIVSKKYNWGGKYTLDDINNLIPKKIPFTLKFEAKYEVAIEYNPMSTILYHATDEIYRDKILKIGLIPKSKNKIANHPDRIYLTFRKEDAYLFAYNPLSNIKNWIVFEVDLSKAKNKIRLFKDPNMSNKGCYTYENIHPICLKLLT